MVDHKQKNFIFGRLMIYLKVELASRSLKRAALIAYIVIETVKQWAKNSKIFWHQNVGDELNTKPRSL